MMRALFAGVQGLRAHQTRMDVIGNNIANVNTTAFKASRVNFAEMYNQTLGGATSPSAARGGTNPRQVGLGVGVSSIETIMDEGSMQLTGKATDMAISGNGFFVLRDGGKYAYTRAGNFDFDAQGFLVNPATGQRVQGWMPDKTTGQFPTRELANMTDIQLPVADSVLASATTTVDFDQSLNANAPVWASGQPTHTTAMTVIDSLGQEHTITLNLFKTDNNTWNVEARDANGAALTLGGLTYSTPAPGTTAYVAPPAGQVQLQFNTDGSLHDNDADPATAFPMVTLSYVPGGGATPMDGTAGNLPPIKLDMTKLIQPAIAGATTSTMRALSYDGYPTGALDRIAIDNQGVVTGYYTNGQYREVGQIALANFFNPAGLLKDGNNNWIESPNSGLALVGAAGESGRGVIASNNLEMSNVDISQEFTNMIVTQRGFQANSRIITTSDEMLQEVVNLKR
jgi:flagellar hook protein FlgE